MPAPTRRDRLARLLACVLGLLLPCVVVGAASAQGAADAPRLAPTLDPRQHKAESLLVVHYHRPDGDYADWNLWCWPEAGEGTSFAFAGTDLYGRYAIVPFRTTPGRAGIIVRRGEWREKDVDQDRFIDMKPGVVEVWIVSGEVDVRHDPRQVDLSFKALGAFLDAADRITLATTAPLSPRQRKGIAVARRGMFHGRGSTLPVAEITAQAPSGGKPVYEIRLGAAVAPDDVAGLELRFDERLFNDLPPTTVHARDVLDGEAFTAADARLGPRWSADATEFVTWSPVAESVHLVLWRDPAAAPAVVPLARGEHGLWSTRVEGDLHGVAYRYRFVTYGETHEAPDVHCLAATSDSRRSVVVDLGRLEPEGWASIPSPPRARPTDEILYELHVRDASIADPACPEPERGRYLGLLRGRPRDGDRPSTGLEHVKELGVTAVHLLPVADYDARRDEYNWGYWTTLPNVPESNYASDPADSTSPIRELRGAVAGLHRAGLRVVLDMVFNHASDAGPDSPFGAAVPYYFFRTTPDGRLVNDTGTGNTFADERPMARKVIVDSVLHRLRAYRVDGFRFDLLGCHEPATVKAICAALFAERPDITLYGEPWTGGGTTRFGQGAQRGLPIAVFNDHLRNAIRGDLDGTAVGAATGEGGDLAALRTGVAGAIDDFADRPSEAVSYVSAHDNLTLWDKIVKTQPRASDAERRAMQRLALGMVLTSQGIAFLHGGCDMCRTKQGEHNTFNLGDEINRIDWARKAEYLDVFDHVAGMVRLRRAHPAFRMDDAAMVRSSMRFLDRGRTVAFTLDGAASDDAWRTIVVAYNDEPTPLDFQLPEGTWTVVADADRAGTEALRTAVGTTRLPPYSLLVAHRE